MKKSLSLMIVLGMLGTGAVACSSPSIQNASSGIVVNKTHAASKVWMFDEAVDEAPRLYDPEYASSTPGVLRINDRVALLSFLVSGTATGVEDNALIEASAGHVLHFFELSVEGADGSKTYLHDFDLLVDGEVVPAGNTPITSGMLLVSAPENASITLETYRIANEPEGWGNRYDTRQTLDLRTGERVGNAMEEWYYEAEARLEAVAVLDGYKDNEVLNVWRKSHTPLTGFAGEGKAILTVETSLPPVGSINTEWETQTALLTAEDGTEYSPIHTVQAGEGHGLYYFEVSNTSHTWTFHIDTWEGIPGYVQEKPKMSSSQAVFTFKKLL